MSQVKQAPSIINVYGELSGVAFEPFAEPGRTGVEAHSLYDTTAESPHGPAASLLRFAPGAHGNRHLHPDYEIVLLISGDLADDDGRRFRPGDLIVMPPASEHEVSTQEGCVLLLVREQPVMPLPSCK
jgi:acetyl-CoA synthetase